MLEISFSDDALKEIQKIPTQDAKNIIQKIDILAANPLSIPSKQLKGYSPLRRMRAGSYRVVYYIESNTLEVYLIGKRNDDEVYKKLQRKR